MASHKTLKRKVHFAKQARRNRPIPYFYRLKSGMKVKYNFKRHNWRRSHLKL